eukprot:TRINITY_DN28498_c0_g1_i1.p1 TRINITY_DN28498_c0_g1~~TRINITY_DN28498_c0_g1_i1.p1  ORF type:complete len:451 (+),score=82.66 TRINITY_DN28498_c0_g1_i1:59-1354(+)
MAADAVGGASSAEGGGGAAPAEPAAPARRGQMYIDGVTDADIAAARHVPLADRLKAMVYWSIFVILALDEELVVALGGTVWLYKTAQRAARSVLTVSPVSVLCGAAAAVCASSTVSLFSGAAAQRLAARAATLPLPLLSRPLWVGRPGAAAAREALAWWPAAGVASQHAQAAQQSWVLRGGAATVLASGAHRFSPALWGVRLGVHLAVMARFMRHQRPREELPLRLRLSLACAAAAWSEWWARVLCAPAARIAHEASANPGLGPWGAARRVWACGGLQALWRGAPPLRVELPHMALQLGGFTALRDAAIYRLGLEWDPEAPWWRRVAPRLPGGPRWSCPGERPSTSSTSGARPWCCPAPGPSCPSPRCWPCGCPTRPCSSRATGRCTGPCAPRCARRASAAGGTPSPHSAATERWWGGTTAWPTTSGASSG